MTLIESFVRNPVKVTVGILLVALFGGISLFGMPKQLTPEVQRPTITVETRWPGASPHEVEREIIQEQEEQLKSVEGVIKMSSESKDSVGEITLEFLVTTDMNEALLKVNSRLQQVPEYPEDADEPIISTSNASDRPIAWFILSPRHTSDEQLAGFQKQHPELAEEIQKVREAHNAGLAMLRLRLLAEVHPEVRDVLPPDIDVPKLRRFAENHIEAEFERVPGVSNSNVLGGLEDEMQVIVDPQKLAARGLTIPDVRRVLQGQNKDTSGGDFWEGKRRWVVRTLGQFRTPEQVADQFLAVRDGAPIYVRDVAEVRHGFKKPDGIVRRFGTTSIAVNVQRETGANVPSVMEGLREKLQELNEGLLEQRGLQLTQVYDETDYIHSAMGLVQQNIFIGGALTMIVLMLFLHLSVRTLLLAPFVASTAVLSVWVSPWFFAVCLVLVILAGFWFARGALVVGLAIPTSIIGTFLMLAIFGRSLNVISLAGLAFAVGMLVDNAVVVLENVYRRYAMGETPLQAAVRGTKEVWGAVIASTLTTIAVFVPVLFVQQEAGQLFRDIALAISSAVALSLVISMTLIPTASARLFGRRRDDSRTPGDGDTGTRGDGNGQRLPGTASARRSVAEQGLAVRMARQIVRPIEAGASAFVSVVVGLNGWIQGGWMRRLGVAVLLVGLSLGFLALWPKAEYLPTGNRNLVFGMILPPPGYNLDQLMEMGETIEAELRPYWDVDPNSPEAQELPYPVIGDFFYVARGRQVFLGVRTEDPLRAGELIPLIREVGAKLPGTITVAKQSSLFERGLSAGRTIDVEITGPELNKLVDLGRQVLMQVTGEGPFAETGPLIADAQARPVPSLDLSSPEVHVVPKLMQAAELGVSTNDLGYTVDALVDGAYAGDYFIGGDKIDLTIQGQQSYADRTHDLEALPVATPVSPQPVPLGALADVQLSSGPEQINHRERLRAITIEVTPPLEMPLEDAMSQIREQVVAPMRAGGQLGDGYRITLSGTADKLAETWDALWFNFALAVAITYLLMAALFESWLYPFVIILSVPLGAVGGILGLNFLNVCLHYGNGVPLHEALLNVWRNELLQPLDVLTMLGFVILIGTVVNNAILIVHQSLNHMREDKMNPRDSILASVRTRIRPIFMTTTTTVFGLMPLVLFPGSGSELYRGLGSVVLGGLIISTIFTLFLVPTVFSLMMDVKTVLIGLLTRRRPSDRHESPVESEEQIPVT